jgi:tRNA pseudouridine38-40 synthase
MTVENRPLNMERYKITIAYDGTDFTGSQRQAHSRTVQSELERVLRKLGWQDRSVVLAGRTDSGTHASGQVAAFDLEWAHMPSDLVRAMNASLPDDIAVCSAQVVKADFHPRHDAMSRCYRYRLFCQDLRDPLRERFSWRVWPPVEDLTFLQGMWIGRHDFAAFGSPSKPGGSTIRTVSGASWRIQDDEWIFEICADAFLYRMIRRLVFLQVAVGQARLSREILLESLSNPLDGKDRLPAGLAPASGLTLTEVHYDDLFDH